MLQQVSPDTYTDFTAINQLKVAARQEPEQALQGIARQFEGIFLNMVLKSMRKANFGDPYFDSNQSQFYQEMFDNQLALSMSQKNSMGLADALVKQLQGYLPAQENSKDKNTPSVGDMSQEMKAGKSLPGSNFSSKENFIKQLLPHAQSAAEKLDVPAEVLIAQAAVETGWGKYVSRFEGGRSSYNLFNIKADASWDGKYLAKDTLEVINGVTQKQHAKFRVYDSFAESFEDYVKFLKENPRYQQALENSKDPELFLQQLQQSGYATDPAYANKILTVLNKQVPEKILSDDAVSAEYGVDDV